MQPIKNHVWKYPQSDFISVYATFYFEIPLFAKRLICWINICLGKLKSLLQPVLSKAKSYRWESKSNTNWRDFSFSRSQVTIQI